tara:strand:+ start:1672 stop:2802 length:1131 start_codon:yes stop_codon:yes gene_type:complete
MLRSNRRRSADGLSPQATNIQQSLEQSNLILADIAVQLEADFQDRENRERRLLLRNRQEKLELRRRNIEKDIEYKKTEKKITKSNNKVKGPLSGIFGAIGKILLLFGGLVLLKTLIVPGNLKKIINSETFQNAKAALESTFAFLTKNLKGILVIAGAFLGLKLLATLAAILKVGAGIIAILANPFVIAGIGIFAAAGMQGLGKSEKEVLKELEQMGGYSKENRDKLIEKLKEQKENLSPLQKMQGVGKEIDARILFLEKGLYGRGLKMEDKKEFDWSSIEDADTLSGYENFMLNFETDKTNMNNNKDLVKGDNNKITKIEIEGETVDLRQNNKKQFNESPSETSATNVALVNPVDNNNRYMSEFAEVAGFNDSIFT